MPDQRESKRDYLERLRVRNVGPVPQLELEFAPRLNLFTGDNGLGKSFLLDLAWWALTRRWPADLNPRLTAGRKVIPLAGGPAWIWFQIAGRPAKRHSRSGRMAAAEETGGYHAEYARQEQAWIGPAGRPSSAAIVLYAQVDGSFSLWDPARNFWKTAGAVSADVQDRPPGSAFSPQEVWDGLPLEAGPKLCNGLISDWADWQRDRGEAFAQLRDALRVLSEDAEQTLEPGALTRISLDDVRDMPTLRMPYGIEVPVVLASAAIRRIAALAYLLVWAWQEHLRASRLLDQAPVDRMVLLVDEIECHLHPRWQRVLLPALLQVGALLSPNLRTQLFATTHSPLVMASVEPCFDADQDAWFDMDLVCGPTGERTVQVEKRTWVRRGEAGNWLMSEAFDLGGAGSVERERVLEEAARELRDSRFDRSRAAALKTKLQAVLPDTDDFWVNWNVIGRAKGWLP